MRRTEAWRVQAAALRGESRRHEEEIRELWAAQEKTLFTPRLTSTPTATWPTASSFPSGLSIIAADSSHIHQFFPAAPGHRRVWGQTSSLSSPPNQPGASLIATGACFSDLLSHKTNTGLGVSRQTGTDPKGGLSSRETWKSFSTLHQKIPLSGSRENADDLIDKVLRAWSQFGMGLNSARKTLSSRPVHKLLHRLTYSLAIFIRSLNLNTSWLHDYTSFKFAKFILIQEWSSETEWQSLECNTSSFSQTHCVAISSSLPISTHL